MTSCILLLHSSSSLSSRSLSTTATAAWVVLSFALPPPPLPPSPTETIYFSVCKLRRVPWLPEDNLCRVGVRNVLLSSFRLFNEWIAIRYQQETACFSVKEVQNDFLEPLLEAVAFDVLYFWDLGSSIFNRLLHHFGRLVDDVWKKVPNFAAAGTKIDSGGTQNHTKVNQNAVQTRALKKMTKPLWTLGKWSYRTRLVTKITLPHGERKASETTPR